jgi:hypothetical protein
MTIATVREDSYPQATTVSYVKLGKRLARKNQQCEEIEYTVRSFAASRIAMISFVSAGSMRNVPELPCSRDFPDPIGLQTAGEMIVLGVNRRAAW